MAQGTTRKPRTPRLFIGPKGVRPSVLIVQKRSGMLIERRPRGVPSREENAPR
jgi:hypothetical protein